ncbi:cell division protein SepF [Paraoerskovia marina]|uniref:cell division protein SepF n=1 Tax=Paraoerskovia marina TaxID=545619 RepID=UPI000492AF34|nr:cell division protein SepF [Paraoerskovia marina]
MAGALHKTMLYLGLADDQGERRDEFDEEFEETEADMPQDFPAEVTPIHRSVSSRETGTAVTAESGRIATIHPRSYNDARIIGEAFRGGTPVIINLSDMDDADAKRLVDFSAGLIFGLHGNIERVTNKVFLLSPENVMVSSEPKGQKKPSAGAFYNQS